ncbi:cell adhesion molecule DSCAML1 [Parasteatoda tepidariorum]|uniref:cell adhesion molecule DSCAML1 n=1 Tax=Parasteatoda tepidariorum TaxID=114398 RepID=UPI0039BD2E40
MNSNILYTTGNSLKIQPFTFPPESVIRERASATCTSSFGEKMSFSWLKNGKRLTKGKNIDIRSFPDLSALVIDPLTEEDSGNYTCIVTARGMKTSHTANLEVLVPPSWVHVPRDVDALSGDTVFLDCSGQGTPKPLTTWYRKQGDQTEFRPIRVSNHLNALTNGTLILVSIQKTDEGLYKCNVSNNIGSPLLKTVAVKVIGNSLKIQPFNFPPESVIRERASALCTSSSGEKMNFNWLKNGKTLTKGQNVDIRSFPDISTLIIDPLLDEDSGNYTCIASARGMTASHTANLEVLVPPSWVHVPHDVDALSGNSISLDCAGQGTPKPSTAWYRKQGADFIPISSSSNHSPNGSLLLISIEKSDEGLYRCNISNGIGSPLLKSIAIKVIVQVRPFMQKIEKLNE